LIELDPGERAPRPVGGGDVARLSMVMRKIVQDSVSRAVGGDLGFAPAAGWVMATAEVPAKVAVGAIQVGGAETVLCPEEIRAVRGEPIRIAAAPDFENFTPENDRRPPGGLEWN
jgi:hypothetical protein